MTDTLDDTEPGVTGNPLDPGFHVTPDEASDNAFPCGEPGCDFVAPTARGVRSHRTRTHGPQASPGDGGGEPSTEPPGDGSGAPPGEDSLETMPGLPTRPKRSLKDMLTGKGRDTTRAPREPRSRGKREPLDEGFSWAYGGFGTMLVRTGSDMVPVGKVMEMQAPTIGVMADAAIKGTLVDKIVQPLVKQGKAFKEVGEAMALPVMTAMIVKQPKLLNLHYVEDPARPGEYNIVADGPLFQPYYSVWETNAVQMARGYERKELRRQEIAKDLSAIDWLAPVIAEGTDPIMYMMVTVLGPPPLPTQEAPQGERAA